jgi:hypothetical protein
MISIAALSGRLITTFYGYVAEAPIYVQHWGDNAPPYVILFLLLGGQCLYCPPNQVIGGTRPSRDRRLCYAGLRTAVILTNLKLKKNGNLTCMTRLFPYYNMTILHQATSDLCSCECSSDASTNNQNSRHSAILR